MQTNPDKFQFICLGTKAIKSITSFNVSNTVIPCEKEVTVLGVGFDNKLSFDKHETNTSICKKASRRLAVLKRIGRFLTKQGKKIISTLLLYQIVIIAVLHGISVDKRTL